MADIRADGIAVYVYRVVNGDYEFLQIHRTDATGVYKRSWQIVYGGIEAGETAVQAALREMREEISLAPVAMFQVEYLESFYLRPRDFVLVMPVFAAEVGADAVPTLNQEHDGFRWIPAGQIKENFMWRTQREALGVILEELRKPTLARPMLTVNLKKESGGS
jgi:dihydroneopterin triphosphate diphosphatase